MMWSDEKFDYFKTSDGYLYCVPRNLEREAAEARHKRNMYWIALENWTWILLAYAFVTADIVVLGLLIGFSLFYRGA